MQQNHQHKNELIALTNFDNLPASGYVRLPVMKLLLGVSSATVWRGVRQGTIPKPVKLSERCTAWNVASVREFLASKTKV